MDDKSHVADQQSDRRFYQFRYLVIFKQEISVKAGLLLTTELESES